MNRSIVGTVRHGSNSCGKRIRWLQQQPQQQHPSIQQQQQLSQQCKCPSQQQQRIEQTHIHHRLYSQFITNDLVPLHSSLRHTSVLTVKEQRNHGRRTGDISKLISTQRHFHTSLLRAAKDGVDSPVSTDTKTSTDDVAAAEATPMDKIINEANPAITTSSDVAEAPPTIVCDVVNQKDETENDTIKVDVSTTDALTEKAEPVATPMKEENQNVKTESVANTTTSPSKDEKRVEKTKTTTDTSNATTESPPDASATDKRHAHEGKQRDKKQQGKNTAAAKSPIETTEDVATKSTSEGIRKVDIQDISPKVEGGPEIVDGVRQYSTPELTRDAKFHKAGMTDPTRPEYQNPLHHNNPDYDTRFFQEDFATEKEFNAAIEPAPPLDNPDGTPSYPKYLHDLADDMVNLTMLEMNELINRMADHYGFHEGILSPDGVGDDGNDNDDGDGDNDGGAAKVEAEKTAFDVKLVSYDASIKIKIIKEVRVVVPGLGLKEAKELVEGAPVVLQKGVSKEVAEQSKEKLVALGAVIEIV